MTLADTRRDSRTALIAVVLFLVFDFAALALNFWLSSKIEHQAIGINLAGRQRMLSQRMAKVLLQLEEKRDNGSDPTAALNELKLTYDLFDLTLRGFAEGHQTRGGSDEVLFLNAVSGEEAQRIVAQATRIWQPYRVHVAAVIDAGPEGLATTLAPAADYAMQHNLELLGLMNRLTTELERLTQREAVQIRLYQGLAFALALANFIGAFALYSRRIHEARKSQGLLDKILNKVSASVLVLGADKNSIVMANHSAEQLFLYGEGELVGRHLEALVSGKEGNLIGHRKDGSSFLARTERNEAFLDDRRLYIETVLDVTQQRMTEEHLSSLAYHDLLTHLPNRLLFDDRLRVEIAHAQRKNLMAGVLFIDLDGFKTINDRYGHELGDLVLREVALRLQGCLRECDTVSRRGGDEFTAIITDISQPEDCTRVAQAIIEQVAQPFVLGGQRLSIGASIGISLYPADGGDASLLLSRADEAMYRAKQAGRGRYALYEAADAEPG